MVSSSVCGTLSAVFPLIVIAIVGQRAELHLRLRRHRLYRACIRLAIVCSLLGLVLVVIGQQLGGLPGPSSVPVWTLFGIDVLCLGFSIIAASATSELEEERESGP